MPLIAIKKWKSRNHPVAKSNIRTNSRNNESSSGGDSFELNAISIICHPPTSSDESNESEPNPIEIFEQLPNGKLCLQQGLKIHGLEEHGPWRYTVFNWIPKHLRYTILGQKP